MDLKSRKEVKRGYLEKIARIESGDKNLMFDSEIEKKLYYTMLENGLRPKIQYQIGCYFADFAFPEIKLVVEYDGIQHLEQQDIDLKREQYLREAGFDVLRLKHTAHNCFEFSFNNNEKFICFFNETPPKHCGAYEKDKLHQGFENVIKIIKNEYKNLNKWSEKQKIDFARGVDDVWGKESKFKSLNDYFIEKGILKAK